MSGDETSRRVTTEPLLTLHTRAGESYLLLRQCSEIALTPFGKNGSEGRIVTSYHAPGTRKDKSDGSWILRVQSTRRRSLPRRFLPSFDVFPTAEFAAAGFAATVIQAFSQQMKVHSDYLQ